MTLGMYHEREGLGNRRYRHTQYLKPIAYLENGIYKLTDRNVVAYADGDYHHAVLTANMGVRIGNDGRYAVHPTREMGRYVAFGGPMVKVGGVWTSVGFADPQRIGQSVLWTRPQADMTLTHLGHGLKEEIALKGGYEPEDGLIAFPVDLSGLTWDVETRALLADGEPVAWIQEPYVYGADNRDDTRPITWELHSIAGQVYVLFHLPDLAGMASPVVDPTLTLQPGAAAGQDTFLQNDTPDRNFGDRAFLYIGELAPVARNTRVLIKFDLSTLPDNAVISSATFSIFKDWDGSDNARTYRVFRQKRAWVEGTGGNPGTTGATWNNYETAGPSAWQTAGGFGVADCEQTDIGSREFTATEADGFKDFVLTPTTKAGLDLGNGWLVKADTELDDCYQFDSSEAVANHPKLVVVYHLPGGGMLRLGVG